MLKPPEELKPPVTKVQKGPAPGKAQWQEKVYRGPKPCDGAHPADQPQRAGKDLVRAPLQATDSFLLPWVLLFEEHHQLFIQRCKNGAALLGLPCHFYHRPGDKSHGGGHGSVLTAVV